MDFSWIRLPVLVLVLSFSSSRSQRPLAAAVPVVRPTVNISPPALAAQQVANSQGRAAQSNPQIQQILQDQRGTPAVTLVNGKPVVGIEFQGSPTTNLTPGLKQAVVLSPQGPLSGLTNIISGSSALGAAGPPLPAAPGAATTPATPVATTTFPGYLPDKPYPFVLPPPDIPYFGSKWVGPWGYPIGHYQAFRGTGQYITHYSYYPLSYFGSLMAPFAYGMSGKK